MMFKIYLILAVNLMFCQTASSQLKLSFGPEVGLNMSGLPNKYTYNNLLGENKEINTPVVSPIFGIWSKASYQKRFSLNLDIQYLWVGNKHHYHLDGIPYDSTNIKYTVDDWDKDIFQKISIPLSLGYNFKIGKINSNILLGFKSEYYIKGNTYYKSKFFQEGVHNNISDQQFKIDLRNRWNNAFLWGIGTQLSQKLNLVFTYSFFNSGIYFGDYGYASNDLTFTMRYTLKSTKK